MYTVDEKLVKVKCYSDKTQEEINNLIDDRFQRGDIEIKRYRNNQLKEYTKFKISEVPIFSNGGGVIQYWKLGDFSFYTCNGYFHSSLQNSFYFRRIVIYKIRDSSINIDFIFSEGGKPDQFGVNIKYPFDLISGIFTIKDDQELFINGKLAKTLINVLRVLEAKIFRFLDFKFPMKSLVQLIQCDKPFTNRKKKDLNSLKNIINQWKKGDLKVYCNK
jgi:hypothetical protein